MSNAALNTELLDRAIKFAVDAHAGTERRGKGFPYIVHPLEALAIVATMTSDQELLSAAVLHDTVEDTDVDIDTIKKELGLKVAALVQAESDVFIDGLDETSSWRMRKQAAIDRLAGASGEAKMVALGDKLSNMRAIASDYRIQGDGLWSKFHAPGGKKDHEWHYRGLAKSLESLEEYDAYKEFIKLIDDVFKEV
ncbi:MAG: bifunctional (p)ppGpp synthetase/guanosine-3',5'-bis(diphosphate) 3'-pyrophosphohydrolase [Bacteroidales bacterium]|nr:bifunctional (p)ppGpp synthetase/guanosine-3',5'-bis(diphosphate) 3'-pyrophosphohydrolase [Candidatus Hennigimonas equi]